jgi:hypothetical protein
MSLGQALARLVGAAALLLAGYLWLQGQPGVVVAITAGIGAVFFVGSGLSRS